MLPETGYYRLEPAIPYSESTMDGTDTQALLETAKTYIAPGGDGYAKFQAVKSALSTSAADLPLRNLIQSDRETGPSAEGKGAA